jgi:hypothetical protein
LKHFIFEIFRVSFEATFVWLRELPGESHEHRWRIEDEEFDDFDLTRGSLHVGLDGKSGLHLPKAMEMRIGSFDWKNRQSRRDLAHSRQQLRQVLEGNRNT